jgi:hypothetical protein
VAALLDRIKTYTSAQFLSVLIAPGHEIISFLFYLAKILTTLLLFFFSTLTMRKKELLNNYATTTVFIVNYYPHFTDEEHYHNHIHPLSLIYHLAVQPRNGH